MYLSTNNNNMTDYQTKKGRLKKKDYSADFRLADNDDFFGFKEETGDLTLTQVILTIVIGLPVAYAILWVLLALTPNI